jgi:hypothetical protein
MSRLRLEHPCQVVVAEFVWGVEHCGLPTRIRVDQDGEEYYICSGHYKMGIDSTQFDTVEPIWQLVGVLVLIAIILTFGLWIIT